MNKEILKNNIEQAIKQPCFASPWSGNCTQLRMNGVSEDGKYIMVKTHCDDTSTKIHLVDREEHVADFVQQILDSLPEKYRDKLVTLRHDPHWVSYSYLPVFDTDTQAMWDKEVDDYITAKQEWCDKYGCD